jgi:hypothetical protein
MSCFHVLIISVNLMSFQRPFLRPHNITGEFSLGSDSSTSEEVDAAEYHFLMTIGRLSGRNGHSCFRCSCLTTEYCCFNSPNRLRDRTRTLLNNTITRTAPPTMTARTCTRPPTRAKEGLLPMQRQKGRLRRGSLVKVCCRSVDDDGDALGWPCQQGAVTFETLEFGRALSSRAKKDHVKLSHLVKPWAEGISFLLASLPTATPQAPNLHQDAHRFSCRAPNSSSRSVLSFFLSYSPCLAHCAQREASPCPPGSSHREQQSS